MQFRAHYLVKVIIHWDRDKDREDYDKYQAWLKKNEIYPCSRGGGGSWEKNAWLYSVDDAMSIEAYLEDIAKGIRVNILPS